MTDIYALEPAVTYVVRRTFTDFHGNVFSPGEVLTYVERHFLPYHGGHTIVFQERRMWLQEDANRHIVEHFDQYASPP